MNELVVQRISGLLAGLNPSARLRPLLSREMWSAAAYLMLNGILGIFWLTVLSLLITLGVALSYTLVGLVILAMTMRLCRAGAQFERARVRAFLGIEIASPYKPLPEKGFIRRTLAAVKDPATWHDLVHLILLFPLGIIKIAGMLFTFGLMAGCVGLLGHLLGMWIEGSTSLLGFFHMALHMVPLTAVIILVGFVLASAVPHATILLARAHGSLAVRLLGPSREGALVKDVETLRESRTRLIDAVLAERQRLERDLHDGAQQRLVSVALSLGMARARMESDPQAAADLVTEAHEQTKQAIREIRDLVRGIHPAVLSDRGLDPAISALAGRSPIPVQVELDLDHRPPEAVEATAYFVVAEALTNVAKHSRAARAWVRVRCEHSRLRVEIEDNGEGGAASAPTGGLSGLADRVAALEGRLGVDSPIGGPTRIWVELPCA